MMKKQNWKNDCKGNPNRELSIDRHVCQRIEDKKTGYGNQHGGSIIHIDRTHEIALLSFVLQSAVRAMRAHPERLRVKRADAAAGAFKTQPIAEHVENFNCHLRRHLFESNFALQSLRPGRTSVEIIAQKTRGV